MDNETDSYMKKLENQVEKYEDLIKTVENVLKHNAENPDIRELLEHIHEVKYND